MEEIILSFHSIFTSELIRVIVNILIRDPRCLQKKLKRDSRIRLLYTELDLDYEDTLLGNS